MMLRECLIQQTLHSALPITAHNLAGEACLGSLLGKFELMRLGSLNVCLNECYNDL